MKKQMNEVILSRRGLLTQGLTAASAMALSPLEVFARPLTEKKLSFVHTHTGERLSLIFSRNGSLLSDAYARLNYLLRDFRTGDMETIDPQLLNMLHQLHCKAGCRGDFHIISAYRSPETNAMLRNRNGGGVAKKSLHMQGKAIDIRLPWMYTSTLRDLALEMKCGGVGYYAKSDFIHIDTGPVRAW